MRVKLVLILLCAFFNLQSPWILAEDLFDDELISRSIDDSDLTELVDIEKALNSNNNIFSGYNNGTLIALNKITAKSLEITLKKNESIFFGNVEIKLFKCYKNSDLYDSDSFMLISVNESSKYEDQKLIYQGWLSASNLSLSFIEHPIYEIFAKNCH